MIAVAWLRVLAVLVVVVIAWACDNTPVVTSATPTAVEVLITPGTTQAFVGQGVTFVAQVIGGDISTPRTVTWSATPASAVALNPSENTVRALCQTAATVAITATTSTLVGRGSAVLRCDPAPEAPPPPPPPTVLLVGLEPDSVTFQHTPGTTSCPQFVGNVQVRNLGRERLTLRFTSNHPAITLSQNTVDLPADRDTGVGINFNCSVVPPFETTVEVFAQNSAGLNQTARLPVIAQRP